ncbi:membrane protein [Streptomyces sp. NRRL WC-3626]|uniref:membrane protein n=1 Tax=Streptomyces sp. NRRL WC-3626 TaxID=1463926 RepID=UPI0004BF924C|nr:membrane protein [Streptomyces sp. NRRL WC-3626]
MYGHGAAPPPPSAASVITQRVLYAAAGVLCCGLLACLPLFRIAFLRGRPLDWAAAWVSIPLSIACLAVVGSLPESDVRTDIALALVLILGACASAYYLTVDIRLHRRPGGPYAAPVPPSPHATTMPTQGPHSPYGYQQPVSPYTPTPVPGHPAPPTPVPPQPQPQPQHPGPARIDQVRAELDELSDYLRRQDGDSGRHGNHEGGR